MPHVFISHSWPQRTTPRSIFNLRRISLVRGSAVVLLSLLVSFLLSGFPASHASPLLAIPAAFAMLGAVDTARCMQRRWTFYHSGVLLLVLMDMMIICLILFFLIAPYLF